MKNRTGKYRILVMVFSILTLCLVLAACSSRAKEDSMQHVQPENVESVLGKEREEVIKTLKEAVESGQTDTDEVVLNKELTYKEKNVKVTLIFENDRLFQVQYDFGINNEEAAFEFTQDACMLLKKNHDDSATYPGLPNRIEGLSFEDYQSGDEWEYREYWTDDKIFADLFPEAKENGRRVDLGITLNRRTKEQDVWSLVTIGGVVNPAN